MRNPFRKPTPMDVEVRIRPNQLNVTSLEEVVQNYDVVDVVTPEHGEPYILVSDPVPNADNFGPIRLADPARSTGVARRYELGYSTPNRNTINLRGEYNPALMGLEGLRLYDRMRKSDGTVRGTLRAIKSPVFSARWFVAPDDPQSAADRNAADMVWWNLTRGMTIMWPQVLHEALLMCDFGYYMFEIVWDYLTMPGGKQILGWQKLAPRHPMDVKQWVYDANGGPVGVWLFPGPSDPPWQDIWIPIENLIVFTFDREAGDMCGVPLLRSAYKHWYYKDQLYKIDAIQKERHGIGIPIVKLPPGFTNSDRNAADELGRNLRTNEKAHIVLPPNWDVMFAKVEGQLVKPLESIEHHDNAIRENILSPFVTGRGQGAGSAMDVREKIFTNSTRYLADIVCDTFNTHGIPKLVQMNYQRVGLPKLRARRIGEEDEQRTYSFTLRNLIGAGVIIPDDKLEDAARDILDLPPRDPSTARPAVMPQLPGAPINSGGAGGRQNAAQNQPGAPRQQTSPPIGTPRSNAGTDRSGG